MITVTVYPKTNVGEFTTILEYDEKENIWNYSIWSFGKEQSNKLKEVEPVYCRRNVANVFNVIFYICDDIQYHFVLTNQAEFIEEIISKVYQKKDVFGNVIIDWKKFVQDFETKGYYPKELLELYIIHCKKQKKNKKFEYNYLWANRIVDGVDYIELSYKMFNIYIMYNKHTNKFYYQICDKIHGAVIKDSVNTVEDYSVDGIVVLALKELKRF